MDFNIEIRKKQLENLDQVISSSRARINSILQFLGWNEEKVQKAENLVHCPIDPNHRIPPNCWNNHIEKCLLKREGYNSNEHFLSESLSNPSQSIYIDQNKKVEIIRKELMENPNFRPEKQCSWNGLEPDPRTSNRYISTYSPDERLAFYNYTIENSVGPKTPPEFTTVLSKKEPTDKSLSYKELLAMERDAKRRRTKYRSVHINKKNHTEIIREVINNQMDDYREYLLEKERKDNGDDKDDEQNSNRGDYERPNSSISRHSTHSGSSSRRHDDSSKDSKYKDRDRYYSKTYKHRNGDKYHRSRRSYDDDDNDDDSERHRRRRRRSRSYDRHRKH